MGISPAQLIQPVTSGDAATPVGRPSPPELPVQDHREPVPAAPPVPTPVESPSFSTDMQVDNHHQIYYKVVDDHTGDVLLEIPAEALRRIGESLNVTEIGNPKVSSLDITS